MSSLRSSARTNAWLVGCVLSTYNRSRRALHVDASRADARPGAVVLDGEERLVVAPHLDQLLPRRLPGAHLVARGTVQDQQLVQHQRRLACLRFRFRGARAQTCPIACLRASGGASYLRATSKSRERAGGRKLRHEYTELRFSLVGRG